MTAEDVAVLREFVDSHEAHEGFGSYCDSCSCLTDEHDTDCLWVRAKAIVDGLTATEAVLPSGPGDLP